METTYLVYHLSFFNPRTGKELVLSVPFEDSDTNNSLDNALSWGENLTRYMDGFVFEGASS
jgi:hypothetical protein